MNDISAQEFGEMKAQVAGMREQVSDMKVSLAAMTAAVNQMQATLAEARGGWKTFLAIAGLSGAVTGLLAPLLPQFLSHWKT